MICLWLPKFEWWNLAILADLIRVLKTILEKPWKSLGNYGFRCVKSHIEIPYKPNGKPLIFGFRVQDLVSICWSIRANTAMSRNSVLPWVETTLATKACPEASWEQPWEPRGLQLKLSKQRARIAKTAWYASTERNEMQTPASLRFGSTWTTECSERKRK